MSRYEPQWIDSHDMLDLLKAVQHALNTVRRTSLRGAPLGHKDTYELASLIDRVVKEMEG